MEQEFAPPAYTSEFWLQQQEANEERARFHALVGDAVGLLGGPPGKVLFVFERLRSEFYQNAAAECGRRAKAAKDFEDAKQKLLEQADKERAERARVQQEKENRYRAERNFQEFGVRKPMLELGRDLPEPKIGRDFSNVG